MNLRCDAVLIDDIIHVTGQSSMAFTEKLQIFFWQGRMLPMTPKQLIKHYGDQLKAAVAIGYSESAVRYWIKKNRIPPKAQVIIKAKMVAK